MRVVKCKLCGYESTSEDYLEECDKCGGELEVLEDVEND